MAFSSAGDYGRRMTLTKEFLLGLKGTGWSGDLDEMRNDPPAVVEANDLQIDAHAQSEGASGLIRE